MAVDPIPEGYPRVIPYLLVGGCSEALRFYTEVLGATERFRMGGENGKLSHAELEIGESVIMLADEVPDMDIRGPKSVGGTPVIINVYVQDVDSVFRRAIEAGSKELRPLSNQFYGDRTGSFEDPFGHRWSVASRVEEVAPEEMQKRVAEAEAQAGHA